MAKYLSKYPEAINLDQFYAGDTIAAGIRIKKSHLV
jgi:hypothetical protein